MYSKNPSAVSGRRGVIAINVVGGLAVLASYVHGYLTHPEHRTALWGSLPTAAQQAYLVSMLLATLGYFPMTGFLLWGRLKPEQPSQPHPSFRVLGGLYMLVLLPSALWLPLTYDFLESGSAAIWITIRVSLLCVGAAALGLTWSIHVSNAKWRGGFRALAIVGAWCFVLQTTILDAFVWPEFFPQ